MKKEKALDIAGSAALVLLACFAVACMACIMGAWAVPFLAGALGMAAGIGRAGADCDGACIVGRVKAAAAACCSAAVMVLSVIVLCI